MIMALRSSRPLARSMGAIEDSIWPLTGEIKVETNSLETAISQLGHDIGNSTTPNTDEYFAFERAWNAFVADFDVWQDAGWLWNPTRRDELLEYRKRFNDLLAASKTFQVLTLAPTQKDTPGPDPLDKIATTLTKIGIIAGVVVLASVGYSAWKETRHR